ncbi:hypothetical protein C5748_12765 [Phyllobacterium phragmitis]|uniref:Uncharacterized protein n=1 Tax=Phyllobacterium phragmitis TaxID=2670329 RepID=A0A2S9IRB7_9HYPH|nr:hypothetical protein [Phyllobacterium phragmitis]PRD43075.1 hypothetical protein C5748_12765 [Phyllobacterium phragmitis]
MFDDGAYLKAFDGAQLGSVDIALKKGRTASMNRALIARSFKGYRTGAGSSYDLLAPDASWTNTGNSLAAKTCPTKDAFIEVIRPFNARVKSRLVQSVRKL